MDTVLRHQFTAPLPFDEFRVWAQQMRPVLKAAGVEDACLSVLEYVCTEMLNNVLDHAGATRAAVSFDWNDQSVAVRIDDDGRGVFVGIRSCLELESDIDAALLLSKGKVTTDPSRHTGEGIFFSSRACEWFCLQSGGVGVSVSSADAPWLFESPNEKVVGTRLRFKVSRSNPRALKELFDQFCPQPELRFTRTLVSVALLEQADGSLVSRSQGKRLVMGLERFEAVTFDFTGVSQMQQGFADEVFRVWRAAHPRIKVDVAHANEHVQRALARVGFAG